MLYLPLPANTVRLKSFWLVQSLLIGLVAGYLLSIPFSLSWFTYGVVTAFCLAIPGLFQPELALIPYRGFNKLAGLFARYANELLLRLCFFTLYIAAGNNSSFLKLQHNEFESMWVDKRQRAISDCGMQHGVSVMELPHRHWFSTFIRWAISSGNWWMCCLLPFLILIAAFEEDQVTPDIPDNIYTLY